jgi:hypothetical protein
MLENHSLAVLSDQSLGITLTFGGPVVLGANAAVTVTINGIPNPRTPVLSATEETLTVTVPPAAGYNNYLEGIVSVSDYVGITIGGAAPDAGDNLPRTIIPLGEQVGYGNEGSTGPVTMTISTNDPALYTVNSNGMIHVGLYYRDGNNLIPIWDPAVTDSSPIQVKTFTVFIDSYTRYEQPAGAEALATAIFRTVTSDPAFLSADYSITSSGNVVSFTNAAGKTLPLHMYIFDDNLIKALAAVDPEASYDSIRSDQGVLPGIPAFS